MTTVISQDYSQVNEEGIPGTTRVEIGTLEGRYCCVDDKAYKINSISKSKPGKHGSAKAGQVVDIFAGQKSLMLEALQIQ